jgi:hypothetical protein
MVILVAKTGEKIDKNITIPPREGLKIAMMTPNNKPPTIKATLQSNPNKYNFPVLRFDAGAVD